MTKLWVAVVVIVFSEIASAQSTVQVDQTGNINLSTTTPSTAGTQAPSPLAVQPVAGSASSGTMAGQGSSPSIAGGTGGAGTSSTTTGGTGGSITFASGAGGLSGTSATTGSNGGDIIFNLGGAGTGGMTAGRPGTISIPVGDFPTPSLTFAGNPLAGLSFHGSPGYIAYSDPSPNPGVTCAGWDDQGFRFGQKCAIRFAIAGLNTTFNNGCLVSDGSGGGTLSIDNDTVNHACNTNDHRGNLKLNWLYSYGNGAASQAGVTILGAPFTAGTGTTNFPQTYLNASATGPTSFSPTGTMFGGNAPNGFTGNLEDWHINGGASVLNVTYQGDVVGRRLNVGNSLNLVASDFNISAGWGNTATKSVMRGSDGAFVFKINSSGTGQTLDPTFQLTFKGLGWPNPPVTTCTLDSGTSDAFVPLAVSDTTTVLTVTYMSTPVATKSVVFQCVTIGT